MSESVYNPSASANFETPFSPFMDMARLAFRRAAVTVVAFTCMYGAGEAVAPGELAERPAVVGEAPTKVPPVEIKVPTVVPEDPAPNLDPARFTIFPVTIDADGFIPVKKRAENMADATRAGWLELANASSGALSTETEVVIRPARKIAIEGLKKVADLCKGKVENFRQKLIDAVVPKKGGAEIGTPMIVINQEGPECLTADAGVGTGMVFYDENYLTAYGAQHEIGHTIGLGHGNTLGASPNAQKIGCAFPSSVISKNCFSMEYGDPYTTMGGYRFQIGDSDPINGVSLKRLGAIKPQEIMRYGVGERTCTLMPLSDRSGGPRLAQVEIDPVDISEGGESGKPITISNLYFELSSMYTDGTKDKQLSLKILGTNDNIPKESLPRTFLIPIKGKQTFGKNDIGRTYTFEIGGRRISFMLQSLPAVKTPGQGAQFSLTVARTTDALSPRDLLDFPA